MVRFIILWSVFSVKNGMARLYGLRQDIARGELAALRNIVRYVPIAVVLGVARALCALGLCGRAFRLQNAVATENFRCLTGETSTINAVWIAVRRRLLEEAATWGQNPTLQRQLKRCTDQLDAVVAPLHQQNIPVILAPLHSVSDVLAAIVGASVTPGNASVVVSASAERYNQHARTLGGVQLDYCSIHQENKTLASNLMSLIADVAAGKQNMIIFPDISPDYTLQAEGALEAKLPCRLFGRAAKLHHGVVRLSGVIRAQVIFYHLSYDRGLQIHIHPPVAANAVADAMPGIIEQTLREYPQDWLLWHSHSLYFINH
ncbi:ABC transporter [Trabulsiella odontotermitis]|uniref:ABC transporter n=1 Tax=Trabulsiella odontotermitis TaxID=379893 RepID=A0A0L0H3G7_9ENTR|nr:ABC transporter [Trabulsiella odontotermitis]KNC95737.1 ABC transporter [Trabulsiella odontotermitis]